MSATDRVYTLSEPGAPPPEGDIPLAVPALRGNEWRYVKECLDTNWVSSVGPFVERFERMAAERVGVRHAVATVNGTAALHIALLVAGVQPDDEVLVSTLTFVAPVNAIRYVGAWPVFIDAEPEFWQMDPQKAVEFLERECRWRDGMLWNRASGRRVRAILPVHILGHPCDMDPLLEAARRYGLTVVEDASEALGARYRGKSVGSLGDIGCLSFNGNKIITTGGGGMIVTDREDWAQRARYLTTQARDDPLEYVHNEIGYNYRLTNVLAAIGVAQMEQLDDCIASKRRTARLYSERLADVPGITPPRQADWAFSTFWLYTVLVDEARYGMGSRTLLRRLQDAGIQSRPLWHPIHSLPPYRDSQAYRVEVADRLYAQALSLPCSVGITDEQLERVIGLIGQDRR